MNNKDLEKLINDMAREYAEDNEQFFLDCDDYEEVTDYDNLKHAFIDGFKTGMKFKEGQ